MRGSVSSIAILLAVLLLSPCIMDGYAEREAVLVVLEMNIDGGAVSFVESTINSNRGRVVVLQINSYGGYLSAADRIISLMEQSGAVCIAWIPPGGYAISAAALVSLSCREIYMAPGSVIGGVKPSPEDPKVIEYVRARVRSLLEKQGKSNITWIADRLVNEAKTYTATEAGVIGLAIPATDLLELLEREGLELKARVEPSLWDRLLSVLSNPLIFQILLFAGVILILAEIFTVGFQGYGIAGVLMIIFALYGMVLLPVEILHVALILSGAVLIAIELLTPGFGVFGIAGTVLTAIGFTLTSISIPREAVTGLVITVASGLASLTGLFLFIAIKAAKAMKIRRVELRERLAGSIGYAKTDIGETNPGTVYVLNEDWTAYSIKGTIAAGSRVRVIRVEGLKIYVEKLEE
ncbi:MAG: NfeD family protein [Ignisphaera sp.]